MSKQTAVVIFAMVAATAYLVISKPAGASKCNSYVNSTTQDMCNLANQTFPGSPIVAKLALVQALHESNLLNGGSKLANNYNNLFGIKKACTNGLVPLKTQEHVKGKNIKVTAKFGWCKTKADSMAQYRQVMELPRYQAVWSANTVEEAANSVQKAGYATDPAYASKLIKLYYTLK